MKAPAKWFAIRFSTIEQLAVYQMFHRNKVNKLLHYISLPIIIYSGLLFLIWIELPSGISDSPIFPPFLPFNLGTLFLVLSFLFYIRLDKLATFILILWLILLLIVANVTISSISEYWVFIVIILCQLTGWYLAVVIGHTKIESYISYNHQMVSSNIYFKKRIFLLHHVGRKPSLVDALTQFAIAPFHASLEILFSFGYKTNLQQQISKQMKINVLRFSKGEDIYEGFH